MVRVRGRERVVDSTLTIYNMTLDDAGIYRCSATTHDNKINETFVRVQVYSKNFSHISQIISTRLLCTHQTDFMDF